MPNLSGVFIAFAAVTRIDSVAHVYKPTPKTFTLGGTNMTLEVGFRKCLLVTDDGQVSALPCHSCPDCPSDAVWFQDFTEAKSFTSDADFYNSRSFHFVFNGDGSNSRCLTAKTTATEGHGPTPFSKYVDGNEVELRDCDRSVLQDWSMDAFHRIRLDDGYGHALCLEARDETGSPTLQACSDAESQRWQLKGVPPTAVAAPAPWIVQIKSLKTSPDMPDLCLDLPGGDTSNGALLWTWDCYGGDTQLWAFQEGQLVYSADPSKCVDLLGGHATNGNMLVLWDCNDGDTQKWEFEELFKRSSSGKISLVGLPAPMCMATGAEDSGVYRQHIGDPVMLEHCNGSNLPNEKWDMVAIQAPAVV